MAPYLRPLAQAEIRETGEFLEKGRSPDSGLPRDWRHSGEDCKSRDKDETREKGGAMLEGGLFRDGAGLWTKAGLQSKRRLYLRASETKARRILRESAA